MSQKPITRRYFMIGAAAGVAATVSQYNPWRNSKTRTVSANSKLNVAAIGAGGKGRSDIHGCKSENVVALCDADWERAAETFGEFPNAKQYKDFREMLDKESIDCVTISTPDHFHAIAALHCMEQGKNVYVQKPLTWSIEEARMLREAARKYGVVTQMGNQGHCGDGVRDMCEMIWDGAIGQVKECHIWTNRPVWPQGIERPTETPPVPATMDWETWIGPAPMRPYNPAYAPFAWRGFWDFGCGALGDMACHIADPANWALRLSEVAPTSVEVVSQEGKTDDTYPTKSIIKFEFPARGEQQPVTVYWYDGGNMPPRPADLAVTEKLGDGNNGSLFIGTEGYATTGEYGGKSRLLPESRMADYTKPNQIIPRVPKGDPYINWLQGCKGGTAPASNFDYSGPFTEWILLGTVALRAPEGEKLEWNGEKGKFTNNREANKYLSRDPRRGWDYPKV